MSERLQPPVHRSRLPSPRDYSQGAGLEELRRFHSNEARMKRTCEIGTLASVQLLNEFKKQDNTTQEIRAVTEAFEILKVITNKLPQLRNLLPDQRMIMSYGDCRIRLFVDNTGQVRGEIEKTYGGSHTAGYTIDAGSITIRPEAIIMENLVQDVEVKPDVEQTNTTNITLLAAAPDLPHDDPRQWAAQIDTISRSTYRGGGRETVQMWNARGEAGKSNSTNLIKDPVMRQMSYDSMRKAPEPQLHYTQETQFAIRK